MVSAKRSPIDGLQLSFPAAWVNLSHRDVCFWHLTYKRTQSSDGRYWGHSGQSKASIRVYKITQAYLAIASVRRSGVPQMHRYIYRRLIVAILTLGFAVSASRVAAAPLVDDAAQQPTMKTPAVTQTERQKVQVPGSRYQFELGSFKFPPETTASTDALLTALMTWISANFDLPTTEDHPRIASMSSVDMTNLVYQPLLGVQPRVESTPLEEQANQQRQIVSLYSIRTKTIYLLPEWAGRTPAELSMLIHELVHHMQNVANTAYACPQEREELAYKAQEKWLGLFGRSLLSDFQIDEFTLSITTKCAD